MVKKLPDEMSDHDMLIRLDEKQDALITMFTNHLAHHWAYLVTITTILGGAVASLVVAYFSK
jgi:hypothetical protein